METHVHKRIDVHGIGMDVHGGVGERPLPAVVFIHGGGLVVHTQPTVSRHRHYRGRSRRPLRRRLIELFSFAKYM